MPKIRIFSSSKPKKQSKEKDISVSTDTTTETISTTITKKEKKSKKKSKPRKIKIKSSSDPISAQLEHLHQQSPWLCKQPLVTVPVLERDEAHTSSSDKGLHIGVFYSTYTINRICLKERHDSEPCLDMMDDSSDSEDEDNHNNTSDLSHQVARQHLAESTLETEGQYSIKCMTKKIYKKLYSTHQSRFLQAVANLLVEANYLSKLDHPHILQARGQVSSQATADKINYKQHDAFFLITDRIQETLEDRMELWRTEQAKDPAKYAVDPKCPFFVQALGYCTEIASALTYLHERNIIVLGLTPSSIGFLAESGRLQLCDLSTCREVSAFDTNTSNSCVATPVEILSDEDTLKFEDDGMGDGEGQIQSNPGDEDDGSLMTMMMVPIVETGTVPRYMAPELVTKGAAGASLKADSYSLAIITLEVLTLQKAYSHYRSGQFMIKVCIEGKRPNLSMYPHLPSPVEGILKRAWRHNVDKRWSCAEIYEGYQVMMDMLGGTAGNTTTDDAVTSTNPNTSSLMEESHMQPTRTKSPQRLQQQQRRQPKRELAAYSKATSLRNVTTSGDTGLGRPKLWRNNSAIDVFAGCSPDTLSQQDNQTTTATRHSGCDAQVTAEARTTMAAIDGAKHSPDNTALEQMQEPAHCQEGQPAVEAQQPVSWQQYQGVLQSQEPGEAQPRRRDSLIDDSEDSATRAKDEAIVMGDGTTITIKKPAPSKKLTRNDSKKMKEKRRTTVEEKEEDMAPLKPPRMARTQSVPTVPVASASSAESKTKKISRNWSVDEAAQSRDQSDPTKPGQSSGEVVKKKRIPKRSSSGTDFVKRIPKRSSSGTDFVKTHDNEVPATDSGRKKLPRRKPSNGGTRRKQPIKAASERHLLKPKANGTISGDNEANEHDNNKASHGRRSIDIQEPALAMPPMRRHVSAFQ